MKRIVGLALAALVFGLQPACAGVGINQIPPQGQILYGQNADGTFSPVKLDGSGNVQTNASITGGGDASAANQAAVQGTKAPGTAATKSVLDGAVYNANDPTLTDGQQAALQSTAKGELKTSNTKSYQLLSNVSATGNGTTFANLLGGSYILDIRGTLGGTSVALQVTGADGTLTTLATQTATGSYGTYQIGANSSVRAVLTGGSPSGVYVSLEGVGASLNVPNTGASPFTYKFANSTNATNVKASAGVLTHLSGGNLTATPIIITLYDTAGTPTCGTSVKHYMILPANSTNGSGWVEDDAVGDTYANGVGYCASTAIDGTGAVAANSGFLNISVK